MGTMAALGAKGSEKEFSDVVDYLALHFPAEEIPLINVNKAAAIELESGLTLRRSEAAAMGSGASSCAQASRIRACERSWRSLSNCCAAVFMVLHGKPPRAPRP